jgi:addiction module HigA family antidote
LNRGATHTAHEDTVAGILSLPMVMSTHREMTRKPTTPGEILQEEFLTPMHMSQRDLAEHLGCDVKVINRIVNGRTSVTAEMALKLSASFQTSPDFWLNAQQAVDLYEARGHLRRLPKPFSVVG